jgi:hypothetical protein
VLDPFSKSSWIPSKTVRLKVWTGEDWVSNKTDDGIRFESEHWESEDGKIYNLFFLVK